MKHWAWLVPCWVWKYFFTQLPRERVLVDGQSRFLIRLDEEFALVYHPLGNTIPPASVSQSMKGPDKDPTQLFVRSKRRTLCLAPSGENKVLPICGLRAAVVVGTQHD